MGKKSQSLGDIPALQCPAAWKPSANMEPLSLLQPMRAEQGKPRAKAPRGRQDDVTVATEDRCFTDEATQAPHSLHLSLDGVEGEKTIISSKGAGRI